MDARDYLGQLRELDVKIKYKRKLIIEMDNKGVLVSSREIKKLRKQVVNDITAYMKKRNEIIDTIYTLKKPEQIAILHAKWVDGESLEKIADVTGYSFHTVRKAYSIAMRLIQKEVENLEKP